jgi:hypothetical protein
MYIYLYVHLYIEVYLSLHACIVHIYIILYIGTYIIFYILYTSIIFYIGAVFSTKTMKKRKLKEIQENVSKTDKHQKANSGDSITDKANNGYSIMDSSTVNPW